MKPIRKKILWAFISFFALLLVLLVSLPFIFEDKIKTLAKNELNKTWDAVVDFDDVDVSFIRSFPRVSLRFKNFSFTGVADFEKDTMIYSPVVDLTVNIKSFFNDSGYDIRKLQFENGRVFFHYLPDGRFNWTSFLREDTTELDTTPTQFHFKLKEFVVKNSNLLYHDEEGNVVVSLEGLNLEVSGDLTADSSLLKTRLSSDAFSFSNDGFGYMTNVKLKLDADINANINDEIFYLSDNSMQLNDLPFSLNGWFRTVKGGIYMDFQLDTEAVEFKSLLSLVPVFYARSFEKMNAGGKVDMKGFLKGDFAGDYYPSFNLDLKVANGWFKYPSLPKKVEKINITANLLNRGNTLDETVIDVSRFSFLMAENPFEAKLRVATPDSDPDLKLDASGKINLGMVKEIYPIDENTKLNGLLDIDVKLAGKMSSYKKNQYEKFMFAGKLLLNDVLINLDAYNNPLEINEANMDFDNRYVNLNAFAAQMGKNNISASGKMENLIAYLLTDNTLKGTLSVSSDYLNINDFLNADSTEVKKKGSVENKKDTMQRKSPVILPSNLDFSMNGFFSEIMYDKMHLKNVKGLITLANSELKFTDLSVQAFGGNLKMSGAYNTADSLKPAVNLSVSLNEMIFNDIFRQIDAVQAFIPLFNKATGTFNSSLSLSALLQNNMMPDLLSVFSSGKFNTSAVSLKDVPVLEKIANALNRKDLLPMTLKDLGISFDIAEGKMFTKPFSFKIKDVGFTLGGITRLDKTINYLGTVTLPDKLNLGRFSTYNITIGGTFSKPEVKLDLKSKVTELVEETTKKAEAEITKKVDEAKEKVLEEARKQKEKAVLEAQKQADKIITMADSVGNLLILQAEKQGRELVNKANNPLTKAAAEIAARKLVDEARKKAAEGKAKAQTEAQRIIQKAAESVEI